MAVPLLLDMCLLLPRRRLLLIIIFCPLSQRKLRLIFIPVTYALFHFVCRSVFILTTLSFFHPFRLSQSGVDHYVHSFVRLTIILCKNSFCRCFLIFFCSCLHHKLFHEGGASKRRQTQINYPRFLYLYTLYFYAVFQRSLLFISSRWG